MLSLKSLVRWAGGTLKRFGMKLLGESTTLYIQTSAPTPTNIVSNPDHLTIGFWNVHKNAGAAPYITQLAIDLCQNSKGHRNDVLLGLSEIGTLNLPKILVEIKKLTSDNSWALHQSPSLNFACFSTVQVVDNLDEAARGWPVIIGLNEPTLSAPIRCAVWFVHLRAPMMTFSPENVSAADAQILHKDVIDLEGHKGLDASIAIGDFNLDPYSSSMLGPDHLNAVMCQKVASQGSRVFDKGKPYVRIRPYFYNPMWNSLGDQSATNQPGSFYKRSDPGNSNAWHMIDQVLLRPALIKRIVPKSARVLTNVGSASLLDSKDRIKISISDHLPVVISLSN